MASKIYVLQVGINQYPSNVSSLSGCVNDVKNIHDYLENTFGTAAHVVQLLDSDANRKNVIQQFREHLGKARADDIVLFHYSGHGARWKSAPEFRTAFPDGWDEGLVLQDSRSTGGYDLADKELAILLSEVARNQPHISLLLDCCHSGSATRGADDFTQLRVRQTHSVSDPRPLETYLDGYYEKLKMAGSPLVSPTSQHILLAACERKQKAWEGRDHQGVFTSALLEVLANPDQDLAYASVFLRCREAVRNRAADQDPQFETYSGFKAYSGFLGQSAAAAARRCTVVFDEKQGEWLLERGAIHGLPSAPEKITTMEIYAAGQAQEPMGNAHTTQVGAQRSPLEFEGFRPAPDGNYEAELTSMPSALMPVALLADEGVVRQIDDLMHKQADRIFDFALQGGAASTKYALRVTENTWQIEIRETETLVLGATGDVEQSANHVFGALNKIAQWERMLQLQNDATKLDPEDVQLQLVEITDEGDKPLPTLNVTANVQQSKDFLRFKLVANNTSGQELHFALMDLPNDFSVGIPYNYPIDPTSDPFEFVFPADNDESSTIFTQVEEGAQETLHVMKLLISTERVDSFLLERERIEGLGEIKEFRVTRDAKGGRLGFGSRPQKKITHKNDWFTKTMTIRVVLQSDRVNANEDIQLANDFITIKANPAVTAEVALSSAKSGMRSVGEPAGFYWALEQAGLGLVNFSKTRGEDQSILELSEIDDKKLNEHPLEIELNSELNANEYILPVTFDGESLIVIGQPTKDDRGRTLIRIDHIPETPNQRRSLLKALKLYFFKCVTGDNVNQLRWVEYNQGKVLRHASGVAEKVKDAKQVLVLVHGIIGDTKGIAEGLPLVNTGGASLEKKFDVVLTYDYENLNTPIKQTAGMLKRELAGAGLQEGDGKHVTFLVHSMGGLVSRWFIEKEGGNKVIDHLVMCGTPNDGSPFGNVGQVRSAVSTLGTLAFNVFPATAPYLGPLLYALNGSENITPTLEEMNHDSNFMKDLGSMSDPGVRYSIIAGDVRQYNASQDRLTGRLVAKLGKGWKFSNLFGGKGHDIAVHVDSIRHIQDDREPRPDKQSVTCHHMNYFTADEGLAALSKIEW